MSVSGEYRSFHTHSPMFDANGSTTMSMKIAITVTPTAGIQNPGRRNHANPSRMYVKWHTAG